MQVRKLKFEQQKKRPYTLIIFIHAESTLRGFKVHVYAAFYESQAS